MLDKIKKWFDSDDSSWFCLGGSVFVLALSPNVWFLGLLGVVIFSYLLARNKK